MKEYKDFLLKIMNQGVDRSDRTGTGTRSIFAPQMRFKLKDGFPLVTTKKTHFKSVVHELLWFLSGDTNIKYLKDNNVSIWDEWADKNGDLGRVYGFQWRHWTNYKGEQLDQIKAVVKSLKEDPNSRRHLVVSFNPGELKEMALPPCHAFFQFYVANGNLSLQLYQRSADAFLGVPFNIASYALLLLMVAQITDLEPDELIMTFGDAHIYHNHFDQVNLQLSREPKKLPTVKLNKKIKDIFDFKYEDIILENYESHPAIKGKVAV